MLQQLTIHNFATIEFLDLEFDQGFSVITGETGAGKSIMLDALTLLMGARSETRLIRHGKFSCSIAAVFKVSEDTPARHWLEQQGLEDGETCIIRRVLQRESSSKCYVNDRATTVGALADLGQHLLDIHGQHDHQSLLKLPVQRAIVDRRAGHESLVQAMRDTFRNYSRVRERLQQLNQDQQAVADRMELLEFQVAELDEFAPADKEFDTLEQQHKKLANAAELGQGMLEIVELLDGDGEQSANHSIALGLGTLNRLKEYDQSLDDGSQQLQTASELVLETANEVRRLAESMDTDPETLATVENRMNRWIELARKHRCPEEELPALHLGLSEELDELTLAQAAPENLEQELNELKQRYESLAREVMDNRLTAAKELSNAVTDQMQLLGMTGGQLEIKIEILPEERFGENGMEQLEFLVSTNPGMPAGSLRKTASGGELSRISLAIEVVAEGASLKPTMMFDEVDVGVGGEIAEIVGDRLRTIGTRAQVICVTHLPQVAAQGHGHFRVKKITDLEASSVHTQVEKLSTEERTTEIARMLGGREITSTTLAHAEELLRQAS